MTEIMIPHQPDSEKLRELVVEITVLPIPQKTLRFTKSKNPTPQQHSRHRENIGRIGSLRVF